MVAMYSVMQRAQHCKDFVLFAQPLTVNELRGL